MSEEIIWFNENNAISLENSSHVKEELQDEYYLDNKVSVSETTVTDSINISNSELNGYIRNDKIRKYEMRSVDQIKTDLRSSEVNDTVSNNVKIEDGISHDDMQIEFCNEVLFCNHCHEVYQDYCTKCRVLVHILNKSHSHNAYTIVRELPKYMVETRESIGHLGIFSLKVIPENVRFGPFTGLNSTDTPLRIKGGRIVVGNDKMKLLNWMYYINPARNIYEQNLFPFQYEDELYYCSTRRIQVGEELLVYFGKECEDNLLRDVEMDFAPITKKDVENVYACTFCSLGFSSKEYLADHKTVCHGRANKIFSVKELVQCAFCKIYLEAKEYSEHHMGYCRETNVRCVLPTPKIPEAEVERRSSERHKAKKCKRAIYKCTQCKFRTMYNADFRQHTNEHYKVKMYKCGICHRRYKAKKSLKAHMEKFHADSEGRNVQEYSWCDYFKTNIKNIKERRPHSHDGQKHCQSSTGKFQTRDKYRLKSLIEIRHKSRGKYKCANCDFRTYYWTYLEMHTKVKHLVERNYKCAECELKTNYKSSLRAHIIAKHLKQNDYKCTHTKCEFKTNYKSNLKRHMKEKHLKQNVYKCAECEFKTNIKSYLQVHRKVKHVKENYYKCMECGFKTKYKTHLNVHIKAKHLEQKAYKCVECDFKTNIKSYLQVHIQAKHIKVTNYKCSECEYKTNYKSNLKVHIKTKHCKEKPFKCRECELTTNTKAYLQLHIKAKHVNEYDYKCVKCEFKTNYKSSLENHIKIKHLKSCDYKCLECEYQTNSKSKLKVHIKTKHLKLRDYKCMECEYQTNFKANLERHIKARHFKTIVSQT